MEGDRGIGDGRDELFDERGAVDGDFFDVLFGGIAEGDASLEGGSGIIEVHDGARDAVEGFEGSADEVFAGLDEDLDGNVFGDAILVDEGAEEIEFGIGGGGETDFDLFESDAAEEVEHLEFLGDVHGDGEGLVAIAEVDGAPDGGFFEGMIGPLSIGEIDVGEGPVFGDG